MLEAPAAGGRMRSASECLPYDRIVQPPMLVSNGPLQSVPTFPGASGRVPGSTIPFETRSSHRYQTALSMTPSPTLVFDGAAGSSVDVFSRASSRVSSESPRSFAKSGEESFSKCSVCGIMYDTEVKLRFHMELHNERCRSAGEGSVSVDQQLLSPGDPFACPECALVLSSEEDYRRHLLTHVFKCKFCSQSFESETSFLVHLRSHGDMGEHPYQCFLCDKQFSHIPHLTRHILSHSDDRSFECVECGKHFSRKGHMTRHMAMHSGCRPYTCSDCGKDFAHRTHLRRHEIVHSGLRPFQCTVCHQAFSRKSSLSRHYFIHTTEKPFVCPVCQKGFNRKGRLRNHLRIHIREGYPNLTDYKIERRPITKEFIEHVNKVPLSKIDEGANCSRGGPKSGKLPAVHPLQGSGSHGDRSPSRESDMGDPYRDKDDSEESSSTDSEDGDGEDHLSEEISYFEPSERSRHSPEPRK